MLPAQYASWTLIFATACTATLPGCGSKPTNVAPQPAGSEQAAPSAAAHHHHHDHELNLPPVGPQVSVVFQDRRVEITLAELARGAATIPLLDLWKAALPNQEAKPLTFDLFGSDGFHPSDRSPCARPLTAEMIAAAHINVVSHDITFDAGHDLPGCYHVHAVVRFEGRTANAPLVQASCAAADWTSRARPPLLKAGKGPACPRSDRNGAAETLFLAQCSDSPTGPGAAPAAPIVIDGVELRLASTSPAGTSGRGWTGNQCTFELRLADGSGKAVLLGAEDVPPFNTVSALVRSGSAVWLSVGFNGYAREFPKGGNRVLALDLCEGRVVWRSKDATSNGGLLLVDDYLVSPYGFTNEARSVFVFDAHSGQQLQKLPVLENICPSKSWAPHWHPGERCDAPGQRVGAATNPRIEGGAFLVDTNTGSAAFTCQ